MIRIARTKGISSFSSTIDLFTMMATQYLIICDSDDAGPTARPSAANAKWRGRAKRLKR